MSELTTKRTLVKSPPELWAEVSDLEALAKHLGEFGEIKITRLEPETTVVWEGDRVSGTVKLEPSGWGTKVTLTAELAAIEEAPAPVEKAPEPEATLEETIQDPPEPAPAAELIEPEPQPEPVVEEPPPPPKKQGFWARLFGRRQPVAEVPPPEPPPAPAPPPVEEPEPEPAPVEEPPAPEPPPLQPVPDPEPPREPEPEGPRPAADLDDDRAVAVLTEVLDNLGAAHHRPFSRS